MGPPSMLLSRLRPLASSLWPRVFLEGLECPKSQKLMEVWRGCPGRQGSTDQSPFLQAVESAVLELSPSFHQKNWQHWFSHIG